MSLFTYVDALPALSSLRPSSLASLPSLALPFQYQDATALEARTDAPLATRGYLDDYAADLERRSGRAAGTGGRSRRQGPAPLGPPHNSHEAATAAYHATANKPAAHDTFHTATGRKHVLSPSALSAVRSYTERLHP